MRVIYVGRASRRTNALPAGKDDVIELLSNNWDDYNYQTSFLTVCRINGEEVDLGAIKLLVEHEKVSRTFLNDLLKDGWDGEFPIPDVNYVSTPSEISFYEHLLGALDPAAAIDVATKLRDASYLVRVVDDALASALVQSDGFEKSLQRERGSIKAYVDGWKIFERQAIAVLNLGFRFRDVYDNVSKLDLTFESERPLPHDINVLIGANGAGKSQVLHQMVRDWIEPSEQGKIGFVGKPNLSQVVVISYSPFERFPVDLEGKSLQDNEAYRYFGFRGRSAPSDSSRSGRIRLSHEYPKRNAAHALIACLSDDKRFRAISDWAQKVQTAEEVLRSAFDFDYAAVEVPIDSRARRYHGETDRTDLVVTLGSGTLGERYVPIASDRISDLNDSALKEHVLSASGVTFFKDNEPVHLSSGQRLFAYIVINILGAIRRNSLVLIDEPELFLHPTLEIQFIDMLKKILSQFNSKALLATHSLVTVREVPSDCIHVFERTSDGLVIRRPPFQTFGGDIQRISSYVFGDLSVSKPFERWLGAQIEERGSAEAVLAALGDDVNEELIVQARAMERGQW